MASIKKRSGQNGVSYLITVSNGYDINGKKLIKTKTFKPDPYKTELQNKKELERLAYEFEKSVISGEYMDGETMTLHEYSIKWFKEYAKEQLSPGTYFYYQDMYNAYVKDEIGHYKLSGLKPLRIQELLNHLKNDDVRRDGKSGGLSSSTVKKIYAMLSKMYGCAVNWQIVNDNPCRKIQSPKAEKRQDISYFTPEQALIFLNAIDEGYTTKYKSHTRTDDTGKKYNVPEYTETHYVPLQFKVFFHIALYSGMRKGEILALTFDDVDFKKQSITINKSVAYVNHELIIKETKTKTSNRDITVPHHVIELIKELKQEKAKKQFELGTYWTNTKHLFTTNTGQLMNNTTPYQVFKKIIKRHNDKIITDETLTNTQKQTLLLPEIPLHGLRHTSATLLIAKSIDPKTVSARLGHAQTSTTLNIYAHALKSLDETASNALEDILQAR